MSAADVGTTVITAKIADLFCETSSAAVSAYQTNFNGRNLRYYYRRLVVEPSECLFTVLANSYQFCARFSMLIYC